MKKKKSQNNFSIKKDKFGGLLPYDFKIVIELQEVKTVWYWHKDRHVEMA